MRGLIALAVLGATLAATAFWVSGADRVVLAWAVEGQRSAQSGMAGALRGLRAGEAAAAVSLLAVSFAYGVFHAAGPGHGKILLGGYGAARDIGALRLSGVALAASMGQAVTAVLLVGAGLWALGWSRERMTSVAETTLQPAGFLAIAAIGLWLAWRGLRALRSAPLGLSSAGPAVQPDLHDHGPGCGHAHMPSADDVARAAGWRELLALIVAVAVRPCTGALILLVLTAQLGLFFWGIAGTLAMGLGTAIVTIAVALGAVGLRRGLIGGLVARADTARMARVQAAIEMAAGLTVAWIAGGLALTMI